MDLCDEIYKSLQMLKDEQVIGDLELKKLVKLVCEQFNGSSCGQSGEDSKSNEPNEESKSNEHNEFNKLNHHQKRLFISIYCLYLETSRLNAGLESELNELRSVLDHVDMLEKSKELILHNFKELNHQNEAAKSRLINQLDTLELDCKQRFVDQFKCIELTKDSVVKSGRRTNYNHICQTEYLMDIQTDQAKHLFTCSIQNIEDLDKKFKEIMKSVDRLFTVVKK